MTNNYLNNNIPNGYTFFNAERGKDSLVYAIDSGIETYNNDSLIIKDRCMKKYRIFDNYDHFTKFYNENNKHSCDEIILAHKNQKPKYDIDDYNEGQLETIVNYIEAYFIAFLDLTPILIVCDSSGYDLEKQRWKNSAHIIITNYAFKNANDAAIVCNQIKDILPADCQKVYDNTINKSLQHFRTALSIKNGRIKKIPLNHNRKETIITLCNDCEIIKLPILKTKKQFSNNILNCNEKEIINAASKFLYGWNYRERFYNLLIFDRTPVANTWCIFCERDHHKDNTLRILITKDGVYLKCIRSKKREIIVDNRVLTNLINKNYIYNDLSISFELKNKHIYNDSKMQKFNIHRTLYVRANMKMGKTNELKNYMKNFGSIIVVSFRKTFTTEKLTAFNELKFKSYDEIIGEINPWYYPRLIIQVESLHRIAQIREYDLVVLDESESIFDQFMSSTMKLLRPCACTFQWLLEKSNHCIALDANLSDRTIELIRSIRKNEDEFIYINNFMNNINDKIFLTKNKEILIDKILNAVNNNKNIIVPTNSKTFADNISNILSSKKILLITSETEDKEKIFQNVNDYWSNYQVVIFTPTCAAGISFTKKHFHSLYGYFTSGSTAVESWRQSMYRARDIESGEYNICIDIQGNHREIENIDEMKEYLSLKENVEINDIAPLDFKLINNKYVYEDTFINKMFMWKHFIDNKTLCKPFETFISQCKQTGNKFEIIKNSDNILSIREKYKKSDDEIKEKNYKDIILSDDIDENQFDQLIEKDYFTKDEKNLIKRYNLRKIYNFKGLIDENFMKTYANNKTINIYKNIKNILKYQNIADSLNEIKIYSGTLSKLYLQHKFAIELLNISGFNNIMDSARLHRDEILRNILANKESIERNMKSLSITFNDKRVISKWEFKSILEYINGILNNMYGIKIKAIRKNSKEYSISHNYYSKIFDNETNLNKPYILINL